MEKEDKVVIGVVVIVVGLFLVMALLQPYFEARTFNKFSESKATYWDALVSELRVLPK